MEQSQKSNLLWDSLERMPPLWSISMNPESCLDLTCQWWVGGGVMDGGGRSMVLLPPHWNSETNLEPKIIPSVVGFICSGVTYVWIAFFFFFAKDRRAFLKLWPSKSMCMRISQYLKFWALIKNLGYSKASGSRNDFHWKDSLLHMYRMGLWTQWGKERVRPTERVVLTCIYYCV